MQRTDIHYLVNENKKFDINDLENGQIIEQKDNHFQFRHRGKNYSINIIETNNDKYILKIEGYRFEVEAKDQLDILIDKLGLDNIKNQNISSIKAPMPGLVLDIMVTPGQSIQKGDNLIVLEAMKMENIIKAEGDGVVKSIEVKISDKVDKGQLMIDME